MKHFGKTILLGFFFGLTLLFLFGFNKTVYANPCTASCHPELGDCMGRNDGPEADCDGSEGWMEFCCSQPPPTDPPPADDSWCTNGNHPCGSVGNVIGSCQKDGKNCTLYETYQCTTSGGANYCGGNGPNTECREPCGAIGGKSSESDGPGGCCTPGAADNSQAGCRRDNNPGGFREACSEWNGYCASGFSCLTQTGCALDTDCGFGRQCLGGQCVNGTDNTNCDVARSIEARFNRSQTAITVTTGTKVTAAIYRNGEGTPLGAPVNGVTPRDTMSAKITGPGGFSQDLNVAIENEFTPTSAGQYTLTGSCGTNLTASMNLTVTGGGSTGCPADANLTISPNPAKVGDTMVFQYKAGEDTYIGGDTWSGGINGSACQQDIANRRYTCTATSAITNATWSHRWNNSANCGSATYSITSASSNPPIGDPSPGPGSAPASARPSVTTTHFRVAENPSDFTESGPNGWQPYTNDGINIDYEFKDKTPGRKFIFVEFKDSTGRIERRSKEIRLLGDNPVITGCVLSFDGNNTILNLTGQNFGSDRGSAKITENGTALQIQDWKNGSARVVWPNAPQGQALNVTLINTSGQTADGQCSAVSQLALGAKVFCRAPSSHNTDNVELVLAGAFAGATKIEQKVTIDKEGIVQGINQKLEEGKKYRVSLKAPRSTRRAAEFMVESGTTNLPNFILPVGDIFPLDGGDGKIGTFDYSEMIRQWNIAKEIPGRTADFNKDNRVNSIDYACMRYDFNADDHPKPTPGAAPATSANPSSSSNPGSSANPNASQNPNPSSSASSNPSPSSSSSSNPSAVPSASVSANSCQVTGITCGATTSNSITINNINLVDNNWGAEGIVASYLGGNARSYIGGVNRTSMTISNLNPGTSYDIKVGCAKNLGGAVPQTTGFSNTINCSTQ